MTVQIKNLNKFNADLKGFARKLGIDTDTAVKKVAVDIFKDVTTATRVRTGYARSSWNFSKSKPDFSLPPESEFKEGPGALAKAQAKNLEQLSNIEGVKSGRYVIANAVPYIIYLEEGGANLPGDHMVTRSVGRAKNNIKRVLRAVSKTSRKGTRRVGRGRR